MGVCRQRSEGTHAGATGGVRALALLGILLIGVSVPLAAAPPAAPQPQNAAWPQSRSDLAPDPAVRFGTLANGMRYAILRNATPAKQVSLRLRIGSGSLQESDAQQGLAHFLEHMAFRGSKSVADGEVKKSLERLGLQMGADTNASTAQTQTVYKFDLARNDATSIDRGLLLMRETGDALTLDPKAFASERGVVLSEYRLSDVPVRHLEDQLLAFGLPKQLASQRLPIGKKAILESASVSTLRDYYRKWYRPDRATFIVTGDVDIDAMEAKIRARFGDWKSLTPTAHDPDLGTPVPRGGEARAFIEPGVPSIAQIGWVTPYDDSIDSQARERRELIRQVGFAVLNRRLRAAAAAADRKFSQAGVGHSALAHSAEVTTLFVAYDADAWRAALLEAEALRRQAVEGGVQQQEVDREVAALRAHFQSAAAGAATRTTSHLADELVGSVDRGEVFTSPAQDASESESVFKDLSASMVNEELRSTFGAGGPLAMLANPNPIADGTAADGNAAALAALTEAERGSVAAAPALADEAWPYASFGAAGSVAERKHLDDLDVTQVLFSNGVRLNIKSTRYRADQVLVNVSIAGGRSRMPTDRPSLDWANAAIVLGGTGKLDYQSMQRVLAGKNYEVSFAQGDSVSTFSGETTPGDLATQLQVLAAYVTDPAFRPEAFDQVRSITLRQLSQSAAVPMSVLRLNLPGLLHSADARWATPSIEGVSAAKSDELKGMLASGLTSHALEITVVGDLTVEQGIDAVAATFGAVAARSTSASGTVDGVRFPQGDQSSAVVLRHHGAADQGVAAIAWPTTDVFSDIRQVAVRQLLAAIMTARLFDAVRAAAGAAYSPQAFAQSSTVFRDYGFLLAMADVPPAKSAVFYDAVRKIVQDLRSVAVSSDELDRARNPAVAKLTQAQQTNAYWSGALSQIQSDPRHLDLVRQSLVNLQSVSPMDIEQAAKRYLVDGSALAFTVAPSQTP